MFYKLAEWLTVNLSLIKKHYVLTKIYLPPGGQCSFK